EVRAYKPDPRPYRYLLDQLATDAADAVLIAAHAWDVLGARAVGMRALCAAFAIAPLLVGAAALFAADAPDHRVGQRRLRRGLERPERAQTVHRRDQRLQDRAATTAGAQVPRDPATARLG